MNSRERILAALSNKQPDRVPVFELWINESSYNKLARLLGIPVPETQDTGDMFGEESLESLDIYSAVVRELELDSTCIAISMGLNRISEDRGINKYGVVEKLSKHGEPMPVEGPIKGPSDVRGFDMVSRLEAEDFAGVQRVIDRVGRDKAHFVMISDPFQISWFLRGGMENLLMDYILEPQLAHDLAAVAVDFLVAAIDHLVKIGADVIVINGDLAGERTVLMSPDQYREYIKPYETQVVDYVHSKGLKAIKHTDGNIWPILDDLVETGFDGIHPFQPQCMDIREVKEYLAGKTCIIGNIDCRNLLPFGTQDEVDVAVRETIEIAAPGGGFIISSSNTIHPHCRPENYVAMVRAAHKYGVYGG